MKKMNNFVERYAVKSVGTGFKITDLVNGNHFYVIAGSEWKVYWRGREMKTDRSHGKLMVEAVYNSFC